MQICIRLSTFLILSTIFGCQGRDSNVAAEDTLTRIMTAKKITVGYINYPPAVIEATDQDSLSGQFVEIARYIADELDVEIEFVPATWSTFIPLLQSGQVDVSIAPTYIRISRAAEVAFSRPIAYLGNSAGVRADDQRFQVITDVIDFDKAGLIVAVVIGEAADDFVTENFKEATIRRLGGDNLAAPLDLVRSGQADVGLSDAYVTRTYSAEYPDIRDVFQGRPYDLSAMAWAVRPTDFRLLNFINNSIDVIESSGRLREWEEKYDAHWIHNSLDWTTW